MSAVGSIGGPWSYVDYNRNLHIYAIEAPHFVEGQLGDIVRTGKLDIQKFGFSLFVSPGRCEVFGCAGGSESVGNGVLARF